MMTPDGRYSWVPAGYELPPVLPYREGQPVPRGYHLEERVSRGAAITGFVLTGVPYMFGAVAAFSSNFVNKSGYLLVPWAGPWLTLALRDSTCDDIDSGNNDANQTASDSVGCVGDTFVGFALVMDGIIQAAGGTVLLVAYLAPRQKLVRNEPAVGFAPVRVGSGYGLGAYGTF